MIFNSYVKNCILIVIAYTNNEITGLHDLLFINT